MFSHIHWRALSPRVRNAFLFGLAALLLGSLGLRQAIADPQAVARDPQALSLISLSLKALTGGVALSDVTLQATAVYIAGSDEETGAATLVARGNTQGLVTLNLSGGERQEIRNGTAGVRVGPDGVPHAMALHNCFIDADWFFPVLSMAALASDPTIAVSYIGQELHEGESVYHIVMFHVLPEQIPNVASLVQNVSAMHLYLDATSLLPAFLDFNAHPDNNADMNVPTEIRFVGYQSLGGVQAPTQIQKYLQNTLLLSLSVTNVAVNSGVPASVFTLPAVPAGGGQ